MSKKTIGILHPGAMGVTVGAAVKMGGHQVIWASEGRSAASVNRAAEAGLADVGTLQKLIDTSDIIVSVCPPHGAADLARQVVGQGFTGCYVDVNAVSPATARQIAGIVVQAGAVYVDGGIVGPPAVKSGTTRIYFSGKSAETARSVFASGLMEPVVISDRPDAASALKMCYAAWTKGSTALLLAVRALAESEGVTGPLLDEWSKSLPGLETRSTNAALNNAFKAWRFIGEMEEIASTFENNELTGEFHHGAASIYRALTGFKDQSGNYDAEEVINALVKQEK